MIRINRITPSAGAPEQQRIDQKRMRRKMERKKSGRILLCPVLRGDIDRKRELS